MKERPIIFDAESVRAILAARKTMTRRVIKRVPSWALRGGYSFFTPKGSLSFRGAEGQESFITSRYGVKGDRLWVRETWRVGAWDENTSCIAVDYGADGYARPEFLQVPDTLEGEELFERLWIQSSDDALAAGNKPDGNGAHHWKRGESPCRWRSPLFMPRWASRITLEVTDVRAERVQDISEGDCRAEGLRWDDIKNIRFCRDGLASTWRTAFLERWDALNAKRGHPWDSNPWVWVVTFRKLEAA